MTIKHIQPKILLIEISGMTSLIAHSINDLCRSKVINMNMAYEIAIAVLRYDIDIRCHWMLKNNRCMNLDEREAMLSKIEGLTPEVIAYIVRNGTNTLNAIEVAMTEVLDIYINKQTWGIWSISPHFNYSVRLQNDGDYRIAEWVQHQHNIKSIFQQRLSNDTLGVHE